MKKRVLQMGGLAALLVGLTLSMTGCGLIANALSSISGTIVNARSYGAALSGALVTLQSVSDSSYVKSDTTDSSGNFSFSGLDSSKQPFEITASYGGYFIPPTRVNQNGFSLNIGNIPALKLSSSDLYGLSFITVWTSAWVPVRRSITGTPRSSTPVPEIRRCTLTTAAAMPIAELARSL